MNIQNANNGNFIIENKNRIVFMILLFVLASMKMFGQATASNEIEIKEKISFVVNQDDAAIASLESQIDFVGWFMGSKQSHMEEAANGTTTSAPIKKQIITSGITPNRVLYRTFMKRVMSKDSAVA